MTGRETTVAILARHARLNRHGTPIRCQPGAEELRERRERVTARVSRERPGTDWKVIYDSRAAAEAAAAEFAAAGHGFRSYPCARSRSGHYHLTTEPTAGHREAGHPAPGYDR